MNETTYLEINKALAKPSSPSETSQATNAALLISEDLSCWNVLLAGGAHTSYDCFSELDNDVFFCCIRKPKPILVPNPEFFFELSLNIPAEILIRTRKQVFHSFPRLCSCMILNILWPWRPQVHLESLSDSWIPDWSACKDASLAPSHPVVKVLRLMVD